MIFGVGTDVVEIAAHRARAGALRRALRAAHPVRARAEALPRATGKPAAYLAKRFAAKEAFTKALGTGIHAPANWHGVWVVNLPSGKPVLEFSDAAARALLEKRGVTAAHLSLSDERGMAFATVILECEK